VIFEAVNLANVEVLDVYIFTVFDAQMVFQSQLVPYEEHSLVYL